jgi:hypothetical protein
LMPGLIGMSKTAFLRAGSPHQVRYALSLKLGNQNPFHSENIEDNGTESIRPSLNEGRFRNEGQVRYHCRSESRTFSNRPCLKGRSREGQPLTYDIFFDRKCFQSIRCGSSRVPSRLRESYQRHLLPFHPVSFNRRVPHRRYSRLEGLRLEGEPVPAP